MGVWNSSKQTVHDIIPVFLLLSLLTNSKDGNNHLKEQQIKLGFKSSWNERVGKNFTYILTSHDFSWLQNGQVN